MGNTLRRDHSIESKHCTLQGIYPTCEWDHKMIKRMVVDKKVAPIFKGAGDPPGDEWDECPLCFLNYPLLNKLVCCRKYLCTECYLQIKKPKIDSFCCPFCNQNDCTAVYMGPKSIEEREIEHLEEKKVTDLLESMNNNREDIDLTEEEEIQSYIDFKSNTPLIILTHSNTPISVDILSEFRHREYTIDITEIDATSKEDMLRDFERFVGLVSGNVQRDCEMERDCEMRSGGIVV
eukprot:TRINITY_DN12897_c0_g1_i1.p1 TRINITY_DN12897_c0_g1~~TRINITY_DN12897_c0_g1_i1.p1  ORF type:complete len:235 (-),score=43.39 TRINITY_DN12897_c0_g1_i1:47-751(-)